MEAKSRIEFSDHRVSGTKVSVYHNVDVISEKPEGILFHVCKPSELGFERGKVLL